VQAHGATITTIEGLAPSDEELHPMQTSFHIVQAVLAGAWAGHGASS
jgi:aerobic-type carbon monoxide dehydrogenase small subunit (CoxS/CutS family)